MNTYAVNPAGLSYSSTSNVSAYAKPNAMVVTGQTNYNDSGFDCIPAGGGELVPYIDVCEIMTGPPKGDTFYSGAPGACIWPFGLRSIWPGNFLADITVGSAWVKYAVSYITENFIKNPRFSGIFLDVVGARLWPTKTDPNFWMDWPQNEKDAWTAGNVDFVRQLDAIRRQINPRFYLINNNVWQLPDGSYAAGEQYVDGICLEHHSPTVGSANAVYAGRPYANLGHRRVMAIALSTADALAWAQIDGITHVTDQTTAQYSTVNPPCVLPVRLDRSRVP